MSPIERKFPTIPVVARFESLNAPNSQDSFKLLDRFLSLETDSDFLSFLGQFRGEFDSGPLPSIEHLRSWQKVLNFLSLNRKQRWNAPEMWRTIDAGAFEKATTAYSLKIYPPMKDGQPAEVVSHTALGSLLDAIHIQKLEGFRIRACALDGCLRTFQQKTGYRKLYCSPRHASLASTRRWRKPKSRRKEPSQFVGRYSNRSSRSASGRV